MENSGAAPQWDLPSLPCCSSQPVSLLPFQLQPESEPSRSLSLSATGRQNYYLLLLSCCCVTADQQKLEEVIKQLDAHCSSISPLTQADLATLAPGAACCARFSGVAHLLLFECIEMYLLTCFILVRVWGRHVLWPMLHLLYQGKCLFQIVNFS